jgi:hypothetical protein
VRISYWEKIPPLATNGSNWLLNEFPDAYLWGSLFNARAFLTDDRAQTVMAAWQQVMGEVQSAGKQSNLGGSLQIRSA